MKITIYLVAFIVASYFLFTGGLSTEVNRSVKALWNLGHVVYFALITILIIKISWVKDKLIIEKSFSYISTILLIVALTIGIVIELLQFGTSRSAAINDVANDLLGSFLVIAFYKPIISKLINQNIIKMVAICFCLISMTPLVRALVDEYQSRHYFPVLSDFTSYFEIDRWSGKANFHIEKDHLLNKALLKVEFGTHQYSNINLNYFENDWRGYHSFNLSVINPNKYPIELVLRIYDYKHKPKFEYWDRFNKRLTIIPGLNEIVIPIKEIHNAPKHRKMDLTNIEDVNFFTIKLKKPENLYIQSLYLSEKS